MIMIALILILMIGGILAWLLSAVNKNIPKWISLIALLTDLLIIVFFWSNNAGNISFAQNNRWLTEVQYEWIPQFGMSFHLAMDGISLVMTALTFFLGIASLLSSWKNVDKHTGFYHFNLLWLLAGITGVFLAMDLMLFYFFWEIMLVPMYFIMVIWGHENSKYAGWKFFLFTQISGLMMLLSIIALFVIHGNATQVYTFDYMALLGSLAGGPAAFWIMCGFLIAFFVKLPSIPFHSWLPDAYTESPVAGSVIVAALMSKTAAYGLIRFVIPLFPEAAQNFAIPGIILGVASILYGAKLSYGQLNLKRLISFSSVSHMGFILVGVFSFNTLAYQGVLMQMVAHGLSIAALFIMAEFVYDRTGKMDVNEMGGFWDAMPNMGGFTVVFIMASLGLPGLVNFVAEFLILAGAWQYDIVLAVLATLGLIVSVTYSMRILQKVFHQRNHTHSYSLHDISVREWVVMGSLTVAMLWLGFFPQSVIRIAKPAFEQMKMIQPENKEATREANPLQSSSIITFTAKKGGGL